MHGHAGWHGQTIYRTRPLAISTEHDFCGANTAKP